MDYHLTAHWCCFKMNFAGMKTPCNGTASATPSKHSGQWPTVKADAERTSVLLAYVMLSRRKLHCWTVYEADCKQREVVCRYHTGPGFFVNTYLVFLTVSASIWVYLLLALAGAQTFACPTKADPQKMCSTLTGAAAQLCGHHPPAGMLVKSAAGN
jgi:hypothetical protein